MNFPDVFSIESAVRGTAILAAGCSLVLMLRRASAATRHHVLLCTMIAAIAVPCLAAAFPKWRVIPRWQPAMEAPAMASVPPEESSRRAISARRETPAGATISAPHVEQATKPQTAPATRKSQPPSLRRMLPIVWFSGTALILAASLGGMLSLHRRGRRATLITTGPVREMAEILKTELRLRAPLEILISGNEAMPMVWGIFRHRLLLPASSVEWPQERLRIVLLHELSHIRRGDPASLLITRLALALHWFNPLAWLAARRLRADQEAACDDLVLSHGIPAADYAEEMLTFSTGIAFPPSNIPAPAMLRCGKIEKRIRGILATERNRRPLSRATTFITAFAAGLVCLQTAIMDAEEIVAKVATRGRILDRNGMVLAETKEGDDRAYPYRSLAIQVLGTANSRKGKPAEGIGGVELSYDADLRLGKDVTLTLDARIQSIVEDTLRKAAIGRGAVVIMDPATGEVLANASVPSFDPIVWQDLLKRARQPDASFDDKQDFKAFESRTRDAIINRALSPQAPGSTFHLITAIAAARNGLDDQKFSCEKDGIAFGNHTIRCWINSRGESHHTLDLRGALEQSCGCYFNKMAMAVRFQELRATADLLGFNRQTGIDLPAERTGSYGSPGSPSPSPAEICFSAMGQGASTATPLQITGLTATIANGGRIFIPHINLDAPPQLPVELASQKVSAESLRTIQQGMEDCVTEFARRARSENVAIAGRTGTAQTISDGKHSHTAWFTGYAPATAPRYAITVMVENAGSGMGVCGPIARKILEAITAPGELLPPTIQQPIEGHKNRIEAEDIDL